MLVQAAAPISDFALGFVHGRPLRRGELIWLAPSPDLRGGLGLAMFPTGAMVIAGATEALHHIRTRMSDATARVSGEDRRSMLHERLPFAISAGAIGAWDLDLAADFTEASPELRAMYGFSRDARLNSQAIFATVAADDLPRVQAALKMALDPAGNGQYYAKYRIRRDNDGEERWIAATARAFFAKGKAVHLIGICRDVTNEMSVERLFTEKAQLAEQLSSVAAAVPGAIFSFRESRDGRQSFPYASANFSALFGLSLEEVRADAAPLLARIHADDRDRISAGAAESARALSIRHDEFRYEHPQKGTIWIDGQSSPIAEPGGDIVWHGYIQDVTERKRAEEELRASEARSRAFFDSGLLGVIYWNVNGAITDANDKFLEMLGYSRDDLTAGRLDWVKLTPPEYRRLDESALEQLVTMGRNQRPFEKEYFRSDGTRLPILVACAMLDEAHYEGVAFVLDISEQKKNEARMQKLHADRMMVMQSMAIGIAHEINQPLTATVAYLRAARRLLDMKEERRPVSVPETLDKASAQITRAGEIVARLRVFIAHGEPDKFPLKAHDLIRDAYEATVMGMKKGQIRATLQLNASHDEVLADRVQIVQVLVNLIRNAKEAMEAVPRRELMISTTSSASDIRIDVIDTGVGLSEKVKCSLFEPFATSKPSGMGVGLSISRAIIEAHHGSIWAESNPEGGAIFSFTLPLAKDPSQAEETD
jgi:PAS domain S-box-containing protein